jgi:hypothetical protein
MTQGAVGVVEAVMRDLVPGSQFERIGSFPVSGDDLPDRNKTLEVFENIPGAPPTNKFLRIIIMLTSNRDLVVPFGSLPFAQDRAAHPEAK